MLLSDAEYLFTGYQHSLRWHKFYIHLNSLSLIFMVRFFNFLSFFSYIFFVCILYGSMYQTLNVPVFLYVKETTRDWKVKLHSPIYFSNPRNLNPVWTWRLRGLMHSKATQQLWVNSQCSYFFYYVDQTMGWT